jgi:hypothetical protein
MQLEVNISRFQEYEPLGIVFYVKTLSSDFNTTLNMGAIFAASDYNVLDPPPVDKRHLENQQYSTSCKPSCSLIHGIECAPRLDSNTHLYVARNNDYQGGDRRLYDLCRTYIGSQGIPNPAGAAVPLGEMWVTYQFAFFKPILPEVALDTASAHFQLSNCTTALPLNVALVAPNSNPGFTVEAGHILHLPEGVGNVWLIVINWISVNLLIGAPGGPIMTNCALGVPPYDDQPGNTAMFASATGNDLASFTQAPNTVAAAALTQRMTLCYIVNITGLGPSMNFSNSTGTFQAATFGDIHCTQWQLGVNL